MNDALMTDSWQNASALLPAGAAGPGGGHEKSLVMKADGCRRGASHGFRSCIYAVHAEPPAKVAWSPRVTFYFIDLLIRDQRDY